MPAARNTSVTFVLHASLAAFMTYASMYAFRKPLSAATFDGLMLWGIHYKVILVISQVLGYLSAKFIGIRLISELPPHKRYRTLLFLIGMAEAALVLFAITPYPYGFVWIFFNGLPLGLVWGIVFSYIEGRRVTDILAAFLSISFIVSSGVVKTVGRILIEQWQVPDTAMPALTGLLFFPLFWLAAWLLNRIPEPAEEDRLLRAERKPMDRTQRKQLFVAYAPGLTLILALNLMLTISRDIKDNFMVEIWQSMQVNLSPFVYTRIESLAGLVILAALAFLVFIRNNAKAFFTIHLSILSGMLLVLGVTWLYQQGRIGAETWMLLQGTGLYLSYISFQSVYFERFIATFRIQGNTGYLIYLSDFLGYLGSCFILIIKETSGFSADWKTFYILLSYSTSALGVLAVSGAIFYFYRRRSETTVVSPQF